ncbi:MAG: ArnT family glycosyltransferase, partial [Ktedonobacteraceae bacterium]
MPMILVGIVIMLAGYMRFTAVSQTTVVFPYRADAAKYYNYAYNLRNLSVYSNSPNAIAGNGEKVLPDAEATPGYPLFLSLFADARPDFRIFLGIELWQALLSTVTVLFIFMIFREFLPLWAAILVSLLAAISPQLITLCTYILSETLFTFLLTLAILLLLMCRGYENKRKTILFLAGITFGLAALTRPILQYFLPLIILLFFITYKRPPAIKASILIILGFILVWTPWVARNYITLAKSGDSALMINTIQFGSYPYFMYNNDPATRGFP